MRLLFLVIVFYYIAKTTNFIERLVYLKFIVSI